MKVKYDYIGSLITTVIKNYENGFLSEKEMDEQIDTIIREQNYAPLE